MHHEMFEPRIATREEKRQVNEALGRSFCKTLTELITNSDTSAKNKHNLPQSSGLIDLMLQIPKGSQMDTSAMRAKLAGKYPQRAIRIEVVTAKSSGRPPNEVVVVDEAQGMSTSALKTALMDIGGDRTDLHGSVVGRNLFGRGLSDVIRAHTDAAIHTFDGNKLTIARGEWPKGGHWRIEMDYEDNPQKKHFEKTYLQPLQVGTAVRFVIGDRKRCHIPDPPDIVFRLGNFFMLRLIASDPNVRLNLKQYRAAGEAADRVVFDFPVGQVIDSFSRPFSPSKGLLKFEPLKVDFLLVRSQRELRGAGVDREARENGLLIIDELDAAYDLTFADPDYEKAYFLKRFFGVVRINGLRSVLEQHLNSPDFPTSPLRVDRDGFNLDHEFSRALFEFISAVLKPYYEKEKKLAEEKEQGALSAETRKRLDEALKHLNKYFHEITEMSGPGEGTPEPEPPKEPVSFFPRSTKLIAGRPRHVLLLIRDDVVSDGCEMVATASEGISVQPETETIYKKKSPRWNTHENFFCFRVTVSCPVVGQTGDVTVLVEGADGNYLPEAKLIIEDVLAEPEIVPPETMEFRPSISMGRPGRRNNLVLFVNPKAISLGHHVQLAITKKTGDVRLIDPAGERCDELNVKLNATEHQVKGQQVLRVLVPWNGTTWNQHATVEAKVKIGGPSPIIAVAHIHLDEDDEKGGFFKEVKYGPIDQKAPSQFAAGIITINDQDLLNQHLLGKTKEEYDRRVSQDRLAQQRVATILLEEASFRALQQLYDDNKVQFPQRREIGEIHQHVDEYKFASAVNVFKAMLK
ncbi:MAG: hypothetical protein KJ626_03110 [Verrucomicrobia bacterium]|nr:hypothetical protein [Verrucomicrobiota bacterium]MBU1694618.1 hypothetical protein [Verrucomicrobiota bacterium]